MGMGTDSIRIGVIIRTLVISKAHIGCTITIIRNSRRKSRHCLSRYCNRYIVDFSTFSYRNSTRTCWYPSCFTINGSSISSKIISIPHFIVYYLYLGFLSFISCATPYHLNNPYTRGRFRISLRTEL